MTLSSAMRAELRYSKRKTISCWHSRSNKNTILEVFLEKTDFYTNPSYVGAWDKLRRTIKGQANSESRDDRKQARNSKKNTIGRWGRDTQIGACIGSPLRRRKSWLQQKTLNINPSIKNFSLFFGAYLICSRAWWRRALGLTEWSKDRSPLVRQFLRANSRTTSRRGWPRRKRPTKQYRDCSGFKPRFPQKDIADSSVGFRTTSHNRRVVLRSDLHRSCQRDATEAVEYEGEGFINPCPRRNPFAIHLRVITNRKKRIAASPMCHKQAPRVV